LGTLTVKDGACAAPRYRVRTRRRRAAARPTLLLGV
jgi:hypothetical protein